MSVELPKDSEGREIPLDTGVLFDKDGQEIEVSRYQYYPNSGIRCWDIWSVRNKFYLQDDVYITPPDSWEKLEEDLGRGADALNYEACAYFGKSACDCSSCIAEKGGTCESVAMRDILTRIRKLRGED